MQHLNSAIYLFKILYLDPTLINNVSVRTADEVGGLTGSGKGSYLSRR